MKHIFVIEDQESEQPLVNLASAIAQFDSNKNKLRLAYVFETDSDDIAAIMAKNIKPITAGKAKRQNNSSDSVCVKCGREALLVKSNNLCKPCHMAAMKKPPTTEHKFEKREKSTPDKEAALQARVDQVVQRAQAKGESGTVSLPMAASGSTKSARKLG